MLKINGKTITGVVYKGKRIQRIMVGGKKYYDMYDGKIIGNALQAGSVSIGGKTYSYGAGYFELNIGELSVGSLYMAFRNKNLSTITHIGIDTSRVTSFSYAFDANSNLESLNLAGVSTQNVTGMYGMFQGCSSLTSLDVSNFNTQNVTGMPSMFQGCSSLTSLDVSNFNTQNVIDMQSMFQGCSSLTSLDVSGFGTQNVTNMYGMFLNCSSLTSINLGDKFDASKVSSVTYMFQSCSSLKTITGNIKNLSISLNLSSCPLDHDSAMRIINGLATVTTAQTLTLSSTTKSTLSATEKAVLINKGWTLA